MEGSLGARMATAPGRKWASAAQQGLSPSVFRRGLPGAPVLEDFVSSPADAASGPRFPSP